MIHSRCHSEPAPPRLGAERRISSVLAYTQAMHESRQGGRSFANRPGAGAVAQDDTFGNLGMLEDSIGATLKVSFASLRSIL